MKTLEEIKQDLESQFHGAGIAVEGTSLVIPKEKWFEIARFLKENSEYQFDFLSSVTGPFPLIPVQPCGRESSDFEARSRLAFFK